MTGIGLIEGGSTDLLTTNGRQQLGSPWLELERGSTLTHCKRRATAWISMAQARTRIDKLTSCKRWPTTWMSMTVARTRTNILTKSRKRWAKTWINMAVAQTKINTLTSTRPATIAPAYEYSSVLTSALEKALSWPINLDTRESDSNLIE
ncbi:uncharacterized protein F5891DRAFT_1028629 [Suillus fuscotomentosus]|uniref:Uncharacterized protein n=1 Tax=Suillus fuscotomentosus TaxID=1912939 RepID=A0AAD4E8F1_9AGAM|nr:uncharacterized protein F5891DRAFT_1028629 [Suillus fuscotomentosus]KAG1901645.1 hypothetical protein F5891DRAFT_1028629 [Suillus fuscotomentosus]